MSILIAILALGFIIFIHEFGHFMVAKLFKVPVREFSIGMGPRIISKVVKNTRYSIKCLPFGGSCAMIGEDPSGSGDFSDEGGKVDENGIIDFDGVKFSEDEIKKNNFSVISPIKKFFICLAGPFMNFLLAIFLSFIIVGKTGFDVPIIASVVSDSPASMAKPIGLMEGDKIIGLSVPGEKESIICYRDLALFMQLNSDDIVEYKYPLVVTFERKMRNTSIDHTETLKTIVYPEYDDTYKKAIIGITFDNTHKKPVSFFENLDMAAKEFYFYIKTTVMSLRMLISGKLGAKDISGPIGTVAVMGDAINEAKTMSMETMIYTIFSLVVLISANLGVMNLLPIPALDGGRIVFAAIEMIIGRPINKELEAKANAITMILLLLFMIWIFGMDIYKLMMR